MQSDGGMQQAPLVTTGWVARRLGVSEQRVRQLAAAERIRVALVTAAGIRLYDPRDVEQFAQERKGQSR